MTLEEVGQIQVGSLIRVYDYSYLYNREVITYLKVTEIVQSKDIYGRKMDLITLQVRYENQLLFTNLSLSYWSNALLDDRFILVHL